MSDLGPSPQESLSTSCKTEAVGSLRDGDIYFWSYKVVRDHGQYGDYHCKSRRAIVRRGLLIDTYWSDMTSERALNLDRVNIEYKGNESELRRIHEDEISYYLPEDVVDMRHGNDGRAPIYVKPDAVRRPERILEFLRYRRDRREADIRYAVNDIERIDKAILRVESGDVSGYFP